MLCRLYVVICFHLSWLSSDVVLSSAAHLGAVQLVTRVDRGLQRHDRDSGCMYDRRSWLAWRVLLKVDTLQVLLHFSQPSFSASLAEDFQEVKGRQANDNKCNYFQDINSPNWALVPEV